MIGHVVGYHIVDKMVSRHGPSVLMLMKPSRPHHRTASYNIILLLVFSKLVLHLINFNVFSLFFVFSPFPPYISVPTVDKHLTQSMTSSFIC